MSGRSMKGTKTYGGSGSESSLSAKSSQFKRHTPLVGFPQKVAFKTMDEIEAYLSGVKIQCLLCGHEFRLLSRHLTLHHHVSPESYKDGFGIPRSIALATNDIKARTSKQASLNNSTMTKEEVAERLAMMRANWRRGEAVCQVAKQKIVDVGRGNKGRTFAIEKINAPCPECGTLVCVAKNVAKRGRYFCDECKRKAYLESQRKYLSANHDKVLASHRERYHRRKSTNQQEE